MDNWYSRVKDEIKQQQEDLVWMSEDKVREFLQFTLKSPISIRVFSLQSSHISYAACRENLCKS